MPTYEYVCDACGHAFEKFQKMNDEPVKICPECGAEKVRKLVSGGSGLIFKGSGFYITDYKNGKSAKKESKTPKAENKQDKPKAT